MTHNKRKVKVEIKSNISVTTTEKVNQTPGEKPEVCEEIVIEELSIDGICGVY
jgi:mycofactocin precursor